ncbi:MAG TPA: hypothetical protein VLW53_09910, partial [Candidatus Eisenbacteria bacterium]|nr:hypothetical protein [Candidatus Eisenbacteria bacterium]
MTDDRSALTRLLAAATAPAEGPVPGEEAALAAFRTLGPGAPAARAGRRHMLRSMTTAKVAAAALAGGLSLVGGVAAAATGSLPGAAQDTARTVLGKVGVTVPGADDHAGTHPDSRGSSATAPNATPSPSASAGKGAEISKLATTTTATGVDKGALISGTASGGKSHAGQHGTAASRPSSAPTSTPTATP